MKENETKALFPEMDDDRPIIALSPEGRLVAIVMFGIASLLGLLFYISANTDPKEVSFSNDESLPELNVDGVLGSKSKQAQDPRAQQLAQQQARAKQQSTSGPSFDPSSVKVSTKGKITTLSGTTSATVDTTYSPDYYIAGDLGLDGDQHYLALYINGTEKITYSVGPSKLGRSISYDGASLAVEENDHDFSKYFLHLKDLNGGSNTIKMVLYGDEKRTNKVDTLEFKVERKVPSKEVDMNFSSSSKVEPENFFNLIGINLDNDKIWEYIPPVSINQDIYTSEEFLGKSNKLKEYSIKKVGEAKLDEGNFPAYSITYKYSDDETVYITGYIKDSQFYYFTNASKIQTRSDEVLMYYFKPSEYSLKETVVETVSFKLDKESDNEFYSDTDPYVCTSEDLSRDEVFDTDGFEVTTNSVVRDKFGLCREYYYKAEYHTGSDFGGMSDLDSDFEKDFRKLNIDFEDDYETSGFYSLNEYTCEDRSIRKFDDKYKDNLEKIGETNTDQDVFILNESTDKYSSPHLSGLFKNSDMQDSTSVSDEEWKDALKDQKEDLPMLVIEHEDDGYFVYVRSNYVYLEDC